MVELSRHVEQAQRTELPPITPVDRSIDLPLSFAQERFWFLHNLGAGAAYHMPVVLRLAGELEVESLRRSFEEVVRRHEVLRTTIDGGSRSPTQRIHLPGQWGLSVSDLRNSPEQSLECRRQVTAEIERPFDLTVEFPLRTMLIASWRPGAHPGDHAPSHRGGRLVDGRAGKRIVFALSCVF